MPIECDSYCFQTMLNIYERAKPAGRARYDFKKHITFSAMADAPLNIAMQEAAEAPPMGESRLLITKMVSGTDL